MAWAFRAGSFTVQAAGNFPQSVALGAATVQGDRIIVLVNTARNGAAPTTPTVSDNRNAGNYTEDAFVAFSDGTFQERVSVFSHANADTGTPTITVTSASSAGGFVAEAYSGLLTSDPGTDRTVGASGTGGQASSGATAATTAVNELVVGAYSDGGYGIVLDATDVGSGFTFRGAHGNDSTNGEFLFEDKDSGGTLAAQTANLTTGDPGGVVGWGMLAVVYKLDAGGAPATSLVPPSPTRRMLPILAR